MNHTDFVNNIKAKLERAESSVTKDCSIYRVPFDIRRLKEDVYSPKVVSIGPFHHNCHTHLQNMERLKLLYCKSFLARAETTLDNWILYIEEVEPNFRRCYSDALQFSKEELVNLILVDSGFILELFWRYYYDEWSRDGDATFRLKPWLATNIRLDLLLLENQLPFFVLENLFNKSFQSTLASGKIPSFLEFTFNYFAHYNRSNLGFNGISISHFTDLIRTFHLQHPPERRSGRNAEPVMHLHSTTELLEAGMTFKVNTKRNCLLDLSFSGQVLEIPQLKLEDWTELLFRNMVALEQCHYPYEAYVSDYVAVLDFLVNTSRDVDILVGNEVLVNWLGDSDSAANLFNGLWKNVIHAKFSSDHFHLCEELNAFCRDPWRKMKATLKRDYCNTPWQTAASIAGILLLILSVLQSVCSVLQVKQ